MSSDACIDVCSPAVTVQLPTVDDCNERTTKKRRKGSKEKNDDNWRYSTASRTDCTPGNPPPQRTHTMPPMSILDSPGVRGRRRQRHCRHLDMHDMSTIARDSGALGRENVRPRNVDRKVDMFQPTTSRPRRGTAARPAQTK